MSSTSDLGDVFTGGATTSQHVDAQDDAHFENTTFQLKRTRSLGLLDEFIDPQEQEKIIHQQNEAKAASLSHKPNSEYDYNDSSKTYKSNDTHSSNDNNHDDNTYSIVDDTESPLSSYQSPPPSSAAAAASGKSPSPIVAAKSPEILPHDDTDITNEPSRHVDYLSHQWDVFDISKSWRYVISKRKDVANSARLENASWRTWAQRRSNLKTISPEVVNWSKDSDVTWLYGPILKDEDDNSDQDANEDHKRATIATSAAAGDISIPQKNKSGPKPILKRRTVEDMIISHSNLLKLQLATNKLQDRDRNNTRRRRGSQRERIDEANSYYDETHPFTDDNSSDNNQHQQHQYQPQQQQSQQQQNPSTTSSSSDKPPVYFDYDAISAKLNSQYKNLPSNSGGLSNDDRNASTTSLKDRLNQLAADNNQRAIFPTPDSHDDNEQGPNKQQSDDSHSSQAASSSLENKSNNVNDNDASNEPSKTGGPESILAGPYKSQQRDGEQNIPKPKRRIHFNDEVQQCIAVDDYNDADDDDEYDDEYDDSNDDDTDYYYDDEDETSVEGYIYESPRHDEDHDMTGTQDSSNDDEDNADDDDDDDDDDDEDDDEGGFFLNVKSPNISNVPGLASSSSKDNKEGLGTDDSLPANTVTDNTDDTESVSTNNSKFYRTIQLLPSTTLNYGSSDEESDEENPYTSSLSHNVNNNSSRGYDYYYDYNTVYTVDPNHAIYGTNASHARDGKTPDVVDVPENITLGSNFNYDIIENEDLYNGNQKNQEPQIQDENNDQNAHQEHRQESSDHHNMPIINPGVINSSNINYASSFPQHNYATDENAKSASPDQRSSPTDETDKTSPSASERERLPISALDDSATNPYRHKNNDSESDEDGSDDEDGGLSISARNSSQSLAQSIFGGNMTSLNEGETQAPNQDSEERHFPESFEQPQPVDKHVSEMNPNHSSVSLSKQPHSSSMLSESFFVGGPAEMSQKRRSSSALADQFFNLQPASSNDNDKTSTNADNDEGDTSDSYSNYATPRQQIAPSPSSDLKKKSSPLPPFMNSANAFSGRSNSPTSEEPSSASSFKSANSSAPQQQYTPHHSAFQPRGNTFLFDSDTDSEDEFIEDSTPPPSGQPSAQPSAQQPQHSQHRDESPSSYASLSQVADKNGIRSPSPESVNPATTNDEVTSGDNAPGGTDSDHQRNFVGQARGLASQFLGNWRHSDQQ